MLPVPLDATGRSRRRRSPRRSRRRRSSGSCGAARSQRARETAEVVGERTRAGAREDGRFAETDTGDWTDRCFADVQAEAARAVRALRRRATRRSAFPAASRSQRAGARVAAMGLGAARSSSPHAGARRLPRRDDPHRAGASRHHGGASPRSRTPRSWSSRERVSAWPGSSSRVLVCATFGGVLRRPARQAAADGHPATSRALAGLLTQPRRALRPCADSVPAQGGRHASTSTSSTATATRCAGSSTTGRCRLHVDRHAAVGRPRRRAASSRPTASTASA